MGTKKQKTSNKSTEKTQQDATATVLRPVGVGMGVRLFPSHFKTPKEICGPCENGEQVCMTTRFVWKCEIIVQGHESPLGIYVPDILMCGWEIEIVSVRTKKCLDPTKVNKLFLPALA